MSEEKTQSFDARGELRYNTEYSGIYDSEV